MSNPENYTDEEVMALPEYEEAVKMAGKDALENAMRLEGELRARICPFIQLNCNPQTCAMGVVGQAVSDDIEYRYKDEETDSWCVAQTDDAAYYLNCAILKLAK